MLWFDRTGTTEGVVGEPVTDALFFAKLSPDERRIAINQSVQGNMDLWLFDFGRGWQDPSHIRSIVRRGARGVAGWEVDRLRNATEKRIRRLYES